MEIKNESKNIDDLVENLEAVVQKLENENTSIELAFQLFEKGVEIANILNKKISTFDKKLKILSENFEVKDISLEDFSN